MYRGATVIHWSKSQSNIALSSAEAELNACVKGLSEMLGLYNLISEIFHCAAAAKGRGRGFHCAAAAKGRGSGGVVPSLRLCTDASACRGMLLRHGAGKVKHLSVKQLWSQEVVQCFNVQIDRVPRADNPADLLTHSVSFPIAESQLERLHAYRDGAGGRGPARAISLVEVLCDEDKRNAEREHSSGHALLASAAVAGIRHGHCVEGAGLIKATSSVRDHALGSWSRGGVQTYGLDLSNCPSQHPFAVLAQVEHGSAEETRKYMRVPGENTAN